MDPQNVRTLTLVAVVDLLLGVVLGVVGVARDMSSLSFIGVFLLVAGGVLLAWLRIGQDRNPT